MFSKRTVYLLLSLILLLSACQPVMETSSAPADTPAADASDEMVDAAANLPDFVGPIDDEAPYRAE